MEVKGKLEESINFIPEEEFVTLTTFRSAIHITPNFSIAVKDDMPNWWFRLWCRLFLGWRWVRVDANS